MVMDKKEYYKRNKEQYLSRARNIYNTKTGRAKSLIRTYIKQDKNANRGECTLTYEQLMQLWKNGCNWCGETDWHKLGADRIDISKPHTVENCVCACRSCNCGRDKKKEIEQFTLDGELVKTCNSQLEAAIFYNVGKSCINDCCRGKQKTSCGYIWRYKETA